MTEGPSNAEVNRAGAVLRDWWSRGPEAMDDEHQRALDLLWAYRSGFQVPLTGVVMSLRSFMRSEGVDVVVGQRLKRMPTILDKLTRHPEMQLARMHDIGGCRAVAPEGAAGRRAIDGLRRRLARSVNEVVREYDYVTAPKATGYRAVHTVVRRDGRLIEIQLRTLGQHRWAESVERLGSRTGHNLKDGQGPEDLLEYLRESAYLMAMAEEGKPIDSDDLGRVNRLAEQIRQRYLVR